MKNVIINTVITILVGVMMVLSAMVFDTDVEDAVQLSWFIVTWFSGSVICNLGIKSLFTKEDK